jgi:CheY-like chemotaxis protein
MSPSRRHELLHHLVDAEAWRASAGPDLPVLLLSGYSSPILTQQALAAGVTELLTKPLHSREIATTLARILHRTA